MSRATDAYARLTGAMFEIDPECQNDGRFVLDDQPASTLRYICDECPLFEACQEYARLARPPGGVWAGKRYRTRHDNNQHTNEEN